MKLPDFDSARRRAQQIRGQAIAARVLAPPVQPRETAIDRAEKALAIASQTKADTALVNADDLRKILAEIVDVRAQRDYQFAQRMATAPTFEEEEVVRERLARERRRWLRRTHGLIPLQFMDPLELQEALEDARQGLLPLAAMRQLAPHLEREDRKEESSVAAR